MTDHDDRDLRARLRALDPAAHVRPDDASLDALIRRLTRAADTPGDPAMTDVSTPTRTTTPDPSGRRRGLLVAAAVAVLAVGGGTWLALDDDTRAGTGAGVAAPALELSLAANDPMASCAMFDPALLAAADVAFLGTVTALADGEVSLVVADWYTDGTADQVRLDTLEGPAGSTVSIDGVAFVDGERFLVSANDGAVLTCGYSGPASPELTALYDDAFGR